MLVFIAGLNPEVGNMISTRVMEIVGNDQRVINYRTDWKGYKSPHYSLIVKLQNMTLDCLEESGKRGFTDVSLELNDVDLEENSYKNLMELWGCLDVSHAKSVRIVTPFNSTSEREDNWDLMLLRWSSNILQKLHICDHGQCIRGESLYVVLMEAKSSIESFGLRTVDLTTLGNRLVEMLTTPKLKSFGFVTGVKITHEQIDELLRLWANSSQMLEFCLQGLECTCTTHRYGSCKYKLDMSSHKHLKKLKLIWLNASNITLDAEELINCKIGWMYIQGAIKSALDCLQHADNLETLFCGGCMHPQDIDALVDTVAQGFESLNRLK